MKSQLILASELLGYVVVGLLIGRYIDARFSLGGWGMMGAVLGCYLLWFIQFFKRLK